MKISDYNSRDNDVPKLGETTDQFNRRTGRGFFLNMPNSFEERPITHSWEGDIIYWQNDLNKAQRMLDKAREKNTKKNI